MALLALIVGCVTNQPTVIPNGEVHVSISAEQHDAVLKVLRRYRNDNLYLTTNIPPQMLTNAQQICLLPPGDTPLALLDATAFGNAKNCLLITSSGIYVRNAWQSDWPGRHYLPHADFQEAAIRKSGWYDIAIGDIGFEMATCDLPRGTLISLLEDIQSSLAQPATAASASTDSQMNARRGVHTATLLPNGQVLVAGGEGHGSAGLSGAELYNPATGTWTPTGALNRGRCSHTASLLPNGHVLVTGGWDKRIVLSSMERYDPATGTWTATGALTVARGCHTATLLPDGQVLVAGGHIAYEGANYLSSAERYDPATGAWTRPKLK
jgi:hypothetical protein